MKKVTDKERKDNNVHFERHIQRYEKHIVTKEKKIHLSLDRLINGHYLISHLKPKLLSA